MLANQHIHILGLGLMGASFALALRGKVRLLSGSDLQTEIEQTALQEGVLDCIGHLDEADLVIVAIPAHLITDTLATLHPRQGALVIDLGSTKTAICNALDMLPEGVCAIGGHPMCGLAENGYRNAVPTLYHGARFILCETLRTTPDSRQLAEELVDAIGAFPLWMSRAHHDRTAGAISHLPHMMSFALMRLAMRQAEDDPFVWDLAAGGFDGATRLARTDEAMITGMFRTNAPQLRELVALLQTHLDDLTALLDDPASLRQELSEIVAARRLYTQRYGERMIT